MTTNATTDSCTVRATNAGDSTKYKDATTSATNAANASSKITAYGTPSISIGSGITAAGGSATITRSVSNTKTYYYTSGSAGTTESVAGTVNLSITSNGNNRFSLSGTTLSHSSMTTNIGTDSCTVRATNAGDSSKVKDASTSASNYVTNIALSGGSYSYANKFAAGGSTQTPTASNKTVTFTYTSGSTGTSTPSSTYGSLSRTVSYSMTASEYFTLGSTSTGSISSVDRQVFEGPEQSTTCTRTENVTWTPTSSYNAAGTKTASGTNTCTVTVEANVITRTFVSLVNIYAADYCYINGALNSEGYLDGYLDVKANITYTAGANYANIQCSVPFKDLNLYGITTNITGPLAIFGELGNDAIFRLTKKAMTADSYIEVYFVHGNDSFASERFQFKLFGGGNTTISYHNVPWSVSESFKVSQRAQGQTVAIIEHSCSYMPLPSYIPVEFPFGKTSGTFQIPTLASGGGQKYTLSQALLGGSTIGYSSSTLLIASNGTPTPTVLEFA